MGADVGTLADMGVLYNLSNPLMLQILSRSGLTHLTKYHLGKIMEAAVLESSRRDRSLIVTGLIMFEREADGSLSGRTEPVMWTDWPEFGHLQQYKLRTGGSESDLNKASLKDQVAAMRHQGGPEKMKDIIRNAFLTFLSQLLGFAVDAFDASQSLNMHGIDSLSGVSCQYWFHKGTVSVSCGEYSIIDMRRRASCRRVCRRGIGRRFDREHHRKSVPRIDSISLGRVVPLIFSCQTRLLQSNAFWQKGAHH